MAEEFKASDPIPPHALAVNIGYTIEVQCSHAEDEKAMCPQCWEKVNTIFHSDKFKDTMTSMLELARVVGAAHGDQGN